jgi:nitrous oxidase accessory protein
MKTRCLYLVAAGATAAALALPLWGFAMSAPQYPDETLHLRVARTGIGGDVREIETLQHYIGVRFPADLPELQWATFGIGGLTVLLVLAALSGRGRIGRGYRALCAFVFLTFLVVSAALVQMRLYDVGHDRDPNAPIRAVGNFTPPLIGPVKVGNFTVWSFPHVGGLLLLVASVLSVVGARRTPGGASRRLTPRRSVDVPAKGCGVTRRIASVVCVLGALGARAEARTWTVGGAGADFPLISPAIVAAAEGDVIEVRAGVYREDLLVDKRLAIVGVGRPTLFGTGIGTVVTIVAPGSELRGFVIEGSGTGQTNAMDAAVQITSNDTRIADNVMRRVFYGVVIANGARNEIVDNAIDGLSDRPFGRRGDGVYLYRAPANIVARNRIAGERDAIYFQYAPRGQAVENIVSDSRYGLHDMFSDDTLIAGNEFRDSAVGANIMNSRRIRIERNTIVRNRGVPGIGLTLKDCDESLVGENTIGENARGLLIDGSSRNRFVGNTFRANDIAVAQFSSAEGNAFGSNQFDDNWSDVVLSGRDSGTLWSIGGRGNRWSRYRGFDFDGDGLGDTPHPVVGAYERIEGANPAARLFLQSPAAAGLELAARLAAPAADAVDASPVAVSVAHQRSTAGPAGALLLVALAAGALHRRRTC